MSKTSWPTLSLNHLCSKIGDGLHGTPEYVENSEYFFINGNNLDHGFIRIFPETKKVSRSEHEKHFIKFDENTLFLSINGTLGSLAKYRGESVVLGKSAAYINCSKINVDFLYYYLQQNSVQQQMWNVATGSTIKNLSLASIRNLQIPTPTAYEQKKIAAVLSALDARIDCNNCINAELEAIAKALYDYWFVQFDFPDANGKPYKSSGGKMVYNANLKREIPDGWSSKKIGEYAEVLKGDLITAKDAKVGSIKVVAAGIDFSYMHSESNRAKNTITISGSGANAGFINFWRESIFASDCITVRGPTDTETLLLLYHLKFIQSYILSQATGSAQPHVYPGDIRSLDHVVPPKELIVKFEKLVIPINDQIAKSLAESQQLAELRYWLLPLLMNGQVKVA